MLLHVHTTWAASFCLVLATVAPWPKEQRPVPARASALKLTAGLRAFCFRQVLNGRPSEPCVVVDCYHLCNLAVCCVGFWTSLFHQVWPQQWHANSSLTCVACSLVLYAWPLPLPVAAWMAMVCPLFGKSDYPKGYLEKKASNKTARLVWKTKNQEAANILQVFGFRAGPDGVIRLVSKYLPEKDAEKHFSNLAQALERPGSWEDVVQSVMEHLLEHTFIQPKIEIHAQDPGQARIHWQQRGLTILTYKTVLKSLNVDGDKGHLVSAFVPKAIAESKLVELQALLARMTAWPQKYEATATFCAALNQSAAGHFLKQAAADSMALEIAAQMPVLESLRNDPMLHGLRLDLSIHDAFQLATQEHSNDFTGLRNVGNTCFINAVLQLFLHVEGLQHWIAQPEALPQQVFNRARLLKLLDKLQCFCRIHASRQWAVLTPLQVLQAAFELGLERYGMIPGQGFDAVEFFP